MKWEDLAEVTLLRCLKKFPAVNIKEVALCSRHSLCIPLIDYQDMVFGI